MYKFPCRGWCSALWSAGLLIPKFPQPGLVLPAQHGKENVSMPQPFGSGHPTVLAMGHNWPVVADSDSPFHRGGN